MQSVLFAEFTVFLKLDTLVVILLVLDSVVIPLLTF